MCIAVAVRWRLTVAKANNALRLPVEAVELVHFRKRPPRPAMFFQYGVDFLAQRFDVLRMGSEVQKRHCERLKNGVSRRESRSKLRRQMSYC